MTKRYKTLSVILAGGKGSRLGDITNGRAKPAVPFGGVYRLIDIPLSNLHHSELKDVWVVEQYLPHSLNDHLRNGRPWDLDRTHGGLFILPPYQADDGDQNGFCGGNAEALNLQREFLQEFEADLILVLSSDHLYRFDYRDLIDFHLQSGADVSALVWEAPEGIDLQRYSIFEVDDDRVTGFQYKPDHAESRLVGTEVFLFRKSVLLDYLERLDSDLEGALGDYGDHLLPLLVREKKVMALRHTGYWRDVGTVESYWQAQMQLLEDAPTLALDEKGWPFITDVRFRAPAFLGSSSEVRRSLISPSCRINGTVIHSVLGPGCVVEPGARVEDSILMEGVHLGPNARVQKAIVDAGCEVDESIGDGQEICLHFPSANPSEKKKRAKRTRQTYA